MTEPEPSGADLARRALAAAIKAARERPAEPRAARKASTRPKRSPAHTGRDPIGLGAAVTDLMNDCGWQDPAAGGDILTAWPEIAGPDVAEHVSATAYDADTGRLDVVPDSPTWAAHARLTAAQLIERANDAAGRRLVRQLHVLPPTHRGPAPPPPPTTDQAQPRATGAAPTPEYLRTRAALSQVRQRRPPTAPGAKAAPAATSSHMREPPHIMADIINRIHGLPTRPEPTTGAPGMSHQQQEAASPRRHTASTITDPELEALYDQRDSLLHLLVLASIARTSTARSPTAATNDQHGHVTDGDPAPKAAAG